LFVHPQLSSPNHNFSKPRCRTENSNFLSRPTHQLLGRLKSTIPNLQMYIPEKANSDKLGLEIGNPCRIVFLSLRMNKCLKRVDGRHYWTPGVVSYAMIPRCRPNSRVFFFIVTSIVYAIRCSFRCRSLTERSIHVGYMLGLSRWSSFLSLLLL
jgi:hypothetical protein